MKILVLGNSDIFKRRIKPAMEKIQDITAIEVASQSGEGKWNDYQTALNESQADLVYVSLVNGLHFEWAHRALEMGYHVIIDKPGVGSFNEAKKLLTLAKEKNLCVAEATVYGYHPQIQQAKKTGEFDKISLAFSFPPVEKSNYKYSKKAKGGAIEDLGVYAMTPGLIFFEQTPIEVKVFVTEDNGEVPTSFSFIALYPGKKVAAGHCGFNSSYINRLELIGPTSCVQIDRVFTTPPEMKNSILVNNQSLQTPAADTFELFLKDVLSSITKHNWQLLADRFQMSVIAMDMLRKAV